MHDLVARLAVTNLFGYMNHAVNFRTSESSLTILTGPNGSGKTHFLNIARSMVAFDYLAFSKSPCDKADLTYTSSRTLSFERIDPELIRVSGRIPERDLGTITIRVFSDPLEDAVPQYIERLEDDLWIDRNDGELMSTTTVRTRYGARLPRTRPGIEIVDEPITDLESWTAIFRSKELPTLVETGRLDTRYAPSPQRRFTPGVSRGMPISRIRQYVDQVGEAIAAAKRASLEDSQRADRQFAARALDRARDTVQEAQLRRNYQVLATLNQQLNLNGLTEPSAGVELPTGPRMNPTERRIISLFLDDWEAKLSALVDVHTKLEMLRSIVETKLTGKRLSLEEGNLSFVSYSNELEIDVGRLSSGEQHLLALFTMLIFTALPGTLVLIDEPEISLHAAWKHSFLKDIRQVARLNDLQVVLATHSSGIINGEWDLTEELVVPADSEK
jgi:ABC-type lipoprotein export system ATPase subunit